MMNDRATWRCRLTPAYYQPKGYDDYLFGAFGYDMKGTVMTRSSSGRAMASWIRKAG